jgi:hypothetical protein
MASGGADGRLLECRVQRALAARGEEFVVPGNRAVDRPTGKSLVEVLANPAVLRAGPKRRILASSAETQCRAACLLELVGFDLDTCTQAPARPAMGGAEPGYAERTGRAIPGARNVGNNVSTDIGG